MFKKTERGHLIQDSKHEKLAAFQMLPKYKNCKNLNIFNCRIHTQKHRKHVKHSIKALCQCLTCQKQIWSVSLFNFLINFYHCFSTVHQLKIKVMGKKQYQSFQKDQF